MMPNDHVGFTRGRLDHFETGMHIFVQADYEP